ncbi:RCC1 domain-containing protein [Amycolatopsis suaedae]|uniref:RCC1 domain-containing protein n=1 Tax=Amycolatopsis suaedae TaxID=2510978 RepID=UPI001F0FB838|nr:hypothetical protein [Amycolatopsis suaedae]
MSSRVHVRRAAVALLAVSAVTAACAPVPEVPAAPALPAGAAAAPAKAAAGPGGGILTAGSPLFAQNVPNANAAKNFGVASGVVEVRSSTLQTIALKADGSIVVFNDNNFGQKQIPAQAMPATAVASGFGHLLALKDGRVHAWGSTLFGVTEVPAAARSGVVAISSKNLHNLALRNDGSVVSWGNRTDVPAEARSGVTAVAAGGDHSLALKGGGVIAWGSNRHGQATVPPQARSGVKAIAAGWNHNLVLKEDGTLVAWGYNANCEATLPTPAPSGVVAISAGVEHNAVLLDTGVVKAWGGNTGFGPTCNMNRPVPVKPAGNTAVAVEAGARSTAVLYQLPFP